MFESIGWAEIPVFVVAGLFILGPERLPDAAHWLGNATKQVRDYATGARHHLRTELGQEHQALASRPAASTAVARLVNAGSCNSGHSVRSRRVVGGGDGGDALLPQIVVGPAVGSQHGSLAGVDALSQSAG